MSIETKTRTVEFPRAQREERVEPRIVAVNEASALESVPEFTDTLIFKLPAIELDPAHRDRERILPPGAGGRHGAAYKMLRTQVLRRLDQIGANSLAVVSACSGEGKTLTAINLAIAIAADMERTALLVDFDLRNPTIHRRFGFEPKLGVTDCLQQRRPLQEAMVKIAGYERLTVLPSHGRIEHSSELLSSNRTTELVAEMRTRYANRVVIFDIPPALQADDAIAFCRHVQAGLVVVGEGRTRRDDVPRVLNLLRDLPIVGTVLNASRERATGYY